MFGKAVRRPISIKLGPSIVDFELREVRREGSVTRLEPRAADVLSLLAGAGGRVLSRSELLDACWPNGSGSDEALTQVVAQIRRALGDDSRSPTYLQTVPKGGYRIVAEVSAVDERQAPTRFAVENRPPVEELVTQLPGIAAAVETPLRGKAIHYGGRVAFASVAIGSALIALYILTPRESEVTVIRDRPGGSPEHTSY
jgi:DNA-binding winged helix-turn-helix (wHTH) protein